MSNLQKQTAADSTLTVTLKLQRPVVNATKRKATAAEQISSSGHRCAGGVCAVLWKPMRRPA